MNYSHKDYILDNDEQVVINKVSQ